MKTATALMALALWVVAPMAQAQTTGNEPCPGLPGAFGYPDECAAMMQYRKREADANAAMQKRQQEELRAAEARWAQDDAKKAAKQAEWDAMRAREDAAERERRSVLARQQANDDRAQAASDRKAAAVASDRKAKCGKDYKAPYIGMSIDRVKACVTTVKLTGQLTRADGVVSTYEGGNAYFHVMEGRIISWGKY